MLSYLLSTAALPSSVSRSDRATPLLFVVSNPIDRDELKWVSTPPINCPSFSAQARQALSRVKRTSCAVNSDAGIFSSLSDTVAVAEEGLKGVKTAFDQSAPNISAPLRHNSRTTFDTATLLDTQFTFST